MPRAVTQPSPQRSRSKSSRAQTIPIFLVSPSLAPTACQPKTSSINAQTCSTANSSSTTSSKLSTRLLTLSPLRLSMPSHPTPPRSKSNAPSETCLTWVRSSVPLVVSTPPHLLPPFPHSNHLLQQLG